MVPKPGLSRINTSASESWLLAPRVTISTACSSLISPDHLHPIEVLHMWGEKREGRGMCLPRADPAFVLVKVPHIWNQNIWFQVLAQPGDLGKVTSFLFPPMKWSISQGCSDTQV